MVFSVDISLHMIGVSCHGPWIVEHVVRRDSSEIKRISIVRTIPVVGLVNQHVPGVERIESSGCRHPRVFHNFCDRQSIVDIAVKHFPDQVDAIFGKGKEGHTQRMVENLIDVVERVLFVDDGVKQNSKRPHILFLAAVGFALKNFGCSVVWKERSAFFIPGK